MSNRFVFYWNFLRGPVSQTEPLPEASPRPGTENGKAGREREVAAGREREVAVEKKTNLYYTIRVVLHLFEPPKGR